MQLYRYSPIQNKEQLLEAIHHIHYTSYKLCFTVMGKYLSSNGNIGVFCHYEDEYEKLIALRKETTDGTSDNPNQKYFPLSEPIVIPAKDDMPKTTYTHLYIRKPDPYRHHVGDIDFSLDDSYYQQIKEKVKQGKYPWARIFPATNIDMIELYHPDSDVLAYISTPETGLSVRVTKTEAKM